jgi:hypothetical protein
VAACINAETGVGPSMASGNHVCKPSCADLPTAARKRKKQINVKKSKLKNRNEKDDDKNNGNDANIDE